VNPSERDDIAARLEAMSGGGGSSVSDGMMGLPVTVPVGTDDEPRSIEYPTFSVNPALLDGIWGYGPTRSGVQINENTAMTYTAVFAAVRILAESIGMLPLGIFEGDDDEDVKIRAREHPAYALLRHQPNEEMSAVTWKEATQANLTLWGNGYSRILHDNADRPRGVLPLQSDRTYAERQAGQLRYRTEKVTGGGFESFAPEEILHIPGLSINGLKGLSPIAYAREAIAMGKAAEIFGATFYGNGAAVGGVLQFPAGVTLKPEQLAMLRESWNAMHAGTGNAHKTGVVPWGGTYKRIGIPPNEAQFLESRVFQVREIARIYRIPPHMLGDLERSTHSNIDAQGLEFLIYTLLPWMEKWEQELTRKLCGIDGDYHVKFDDRRLLRMDAVSRQTYYQIGRQSGFLNADEIRAMEGKPPIPGGAGKEYWAPVNMMPADKFDQVQPPGAEGGGDGDGEKKPPPAAAKDDKARALVPVLADAIQRMLRKERNAASRNKADDEFYAQHSLHVREALAPGVRSMLAVGGGDATAQNRAFQAVEELAAQRVEGIGALSDNAIAAMAVSQAQAIVAKSTNPQNP